MVDLKVGVLLPTREQVLFGESDATAVVNEAGLAEELGFDSVWVGDSLLARPRFDPLVLAGAVAARTERVAIGTAILLPSLRHPLQLAQIAATVDRLSQGRLILGVGAGAPIPSTKAEFDAVAVPFDERAGRRDEMTRLLRRLWSGAEVSSDRFWSFSAQLEPRPYRDGGVPMWLGGEGPTALRRAGELYDGWLPISATPDLYAQGLKQVREAAGGREVEAALYLTVTIDADPQRAREIQRAYIEPYYSAPYEVVSAVQAIHAGTVESAVEWIQSYLDKGVTHIVVRSGDPSPTGQVERVAPLLEKLR